MNIKQMRAANAKISPKAVTGDDSNTIVQATANLIGAAPSAVKSFFGDIAESYKYHENVRHGLTK